jgi:hypothetical protein
MRAHVCLDDATLFLTTSHTNVALTPDAMQKDVESFSNVSPEIKEILKRK